MGIHFSTENAALARRVLQLFKSNYDVKTEVVITRSRRLKKNNRYQVKVVPSPEAGKALAELQLLPAENEGGKTSLFTIPFTEKSAIRISRSADLPVITIWKW